MAVNDLTTLWSLKVYPDEQQNATLEFANSDNGYATINTRQIPEPASDAAANGTWVIDETLNHQPHHLWFIKTKNTGGNKIVVRHLTEPFTQFDPDIVTSFDVVAANNRVFTIDNGRLFVIKTQHTKSGFVELTFDQDSSFTNFSTLNLPTAFPAVPAYPSISSLDEGYWRIHDWDLFFIKIKNTSSGFVEVYHSQNSSGYEGFTKYESWFTTADYSLNGSWNIGPDHNLYLIKQRNCESGSVEVHAASFDSGYKVVRHLGSGYKVDDGHNAFWLV
ncbi:MAG: hypothetical protein HETSPECPRED_002485 [Heterodermia speciosa]|uniref:Uncharacterized protein n=1 Tax=Heterodermia speciosa TaxID=116794 RepID=A0A8H3EZM2_9LECA|nr:MAG: hypothetical protein HETSPECPRED_002485 [Heterodermia speciosa]